MLKAGSPDHRAREQTVNSDFATSINWWVDPRERLAVVFMAHTPGPARWHYRELISALVYQAITD